MDKHTVGVSADVSSACAGCAYGSGAVLFVVVMLQAGVWFKVCPSIWLFERLG